MDNNELDKMIRDNLEDYRETPDPRVWDRVQASLDQKKKKSRLIPLWLRWGAAAALLAAGAFWFAPRADIGAGSPAVTREAAKPATPEERRAENPALQETLPGKQEEGLAVEVPPTGQTGSDGAGAQTGPTVSGKEKSTSDAQTPAGVSTREEALAVSSSEARNQEMAPMENKEAAEEVSEKFLAPSPKQGNALAGAETDQVMKTEKEEAAPPAKDLPKKSIFEVVETGEAVAQEEPAKGKWSVGPSVAPVYFNSFGNGSPIASNFQENAKSGTFNLSYGIQVSYQLSKKLSLRSGIHRVDYGYNTDDVGFTSSPTARPNSLIRTISYSENSKNLVVHSTVDGGQQPAAVDVSAPSPAREGQMLQEFGYLEIPVEMQYNLLDRKWGINLIGGLSSLFLMDNSVSLQSGEAVTEIGEATNMNSLNFSTNLGLGFYYRLNSNFEVNLQPMFKYQLNTFSETSGSFQPYSIGVYSGLNFRF